MAMNEYDLMVAEGLIGQVVREITATTPEQRQVLLFAAFKLARTAHIFEPALAGILKVEQSNPPESQIGRKRFAKNSTPLSRGAIIPQHAE